MQRVEVGSSTTMITTCCHWTCCGVGHQHSHDSSVGVRSCMDSGLRRSRRSELGRDGRLAGAMYGQLVGTADHAHTSSIIIRSERMPGSPIVNK